MTVNGPTGAAISLSETSTSGTYSALYSILSTDPLGTWAMSVQALKSGQVASASVSVSISGALSVAVLTPSASKFNVGEVVTVKARVAFQDNSPVSASASVTFNKPIAGSVTMTIDPSDSSGRTWTGSYTVLSTDIQADGLTWSITVTASFNGDSGSSVQNVNLFRSLRVQVATFSSSTFTTSKDNFAKGETVFVEGVVSLQDSMVVSSGVVSFTISGTSIASAQVGMTFNPTLNAWTGSYTLLSSDQGGSQTVAVSAADSQGNSGSGTHQINVSPPQAFSVSIVSPAPNSVFGRGETVTLSVSVAVAGSPATGATVTANTPTGATITLANAGGGTYSAQYTVLSTDPAGTWVVTFQASQGPQSTSAQVAVTISTSLRVIVIGPASGSKFNVGQTATVRATVTLQDGSAIPGTASVIFNRPTSGSVSVSVDTSDPSGRTWTGGYAIVASDVPADGVGWAIVVSASANGNAGTSSPTNVNLFVSLKAAVSTWSSSSFSVPKDSFVRGDTVFVKAQITRQDGSIVSSGTVSLKITGTSIAGSPVPLSFSAPLTAWTGSHTLLQTDQTGTQTVGVTAVDGIGNSGSGTHTIGVEVPVSAAQPLEARISFDPQAKDIIVTAVCNAGCLSPTTVTLTNTSPQNEGDEGEGHHHGDDEGEGDNGGVLRTYQIADSAGHTLTLQVLVQIEGHHVEAQLISFQYGSSAPVTPPENTISFSFSKNKDGSVKNLTENIQVEDSVNAHARFNAHKNTTTIQFGGEDDDDDGGSSSTMNGLWLLGLFTSNGSLNVNFFHSA